MIRLTKILGKRRPLWFVFVCGSIATDDNTGRISQEERA